MNSDSANQSFAMVLGMCQMMLKEKSSSTGKYLKAEDILAVVTEVCTMPSFANVDRDRLMADLQERFTVVAGIHQTIGSDADHTPWLPERRSGIAWRYWDRYRLFLEERLSSRAVDSINVVTNDVLERIEDPQRPGSWDARGLVMGHVQSGKTANYCGLICKAADAGYKVVIVLSGIHNSLRSQTQIRIDEGFLGFMSETPGGGQAAFKRVGVGLIDPSIVANTGTNRTEKGDFNEGVAKQFGIQPGGLPLVFVVKKHVGVLKNLIKWIKSSADAQDEADGRKYVRNVPALVIDDEADLASVDTRSQAFDENGVPDPDYDPAMTNKNIRLLLRSFEKVAYVGYTATPFANIYIHDKGNTLELGPDLFPRNFIVNIPPPSNYMGPARIFGIKDYDDAGLEATPALPITRTVTDHADTEDVDETGGWMPPKLMLKTGHLPSYDGKPCVPPSLRQAMMAYLITVCVRRLRESGPVLNSMLVHVTRYTNVQKRVADQVQMELKGIAQRIRNGDGERSPTIQDEFRQIWREDFVPTTKHCQEMLSNKHLTDVEWSQIWSLMESVVEGIKIKVINGSAGDILNYEEHRKTGMDIIAIGGDKLSRGLTLDGLSVSYFLRSSKMYDTLMQMGRWFGYRDRYIDLCRLYTTNELLDWFSHIAAASEELQREFEYMVSVGGTPRDYGLKVRSHPVMLVTSAVKMRNGMEMRLSFSGDISETTKFSRSPTWLKRNANVTETWIRSLGVCDDGGCKGGYQWNITADKVLDFLASYTTHADAQRADTQLLLRYIRAQLANRELTDWLVRLVSSGTADHFIEWDNRKIGLITRAPHPVEQGTEEYTIRRLVNPDDESADLSQAQRDKALELTILNWESSTRQRKAEKRPERPNGMEARIQRDKTRGLLLLYPLDPAPAGLEVGSPPVIGLAISFPRSDTAKEISYTVNNIFTTRGGDDHS